MVISKNNKPSRNEFEKLINSTIDELNNKASLKPKEIKNLDGNKLEPYVKKVMSSIAIGTKFENSIELISGQKFPDIVANKYYGIEVKTTKQDKWKSTGNSVLESTRVDDVKRIYILFGKLGNTISFRYRLYQECLSEVVVTHSPRYLIDMNLDYGKTIFDKIEIPYDKLRIKDNPIKPITEYYKSKLKPGQDIWWIDQSENAGSNLVINIWSNLEYNQKQLLKIKSLVYFPEIFSNKSDKFARVAIWLITKETIVCPNLRDIFTAGGKRDILINGITYNVPQIFSKISKYHFEIKDLLNSTDSEELSYYWNKKTTNEKKITDWINLVVDNSKTISELKDIKLKKMLSDILIK